MRRRTIVLSKGRVPKYEQPHLWLHYWGPAAAWLGVVAVFSSQTFASGRSGFWLHLLLDAFHVTVTPAQFVMLHFALRKAAHFVAYAVLGALLFRAMRGVDKRRRIWKARYALGAIAISVVTATFDEIHQAFTPGRTGNWHDVALDTLGALFAQAVILFVLTTRRGQRLWLRDVGASNNTTAAIDAKAAER